MPRKAALFAVLVGSGVALAVFLYLRRPGRTEPEPEPFPPDALAGYLPPDSTVVLTLNARELLEAPAARGRLGKTLRNLLQSAAADQPWFGLAGIDPFTDVDQVQVSFAAGDPSHPLWLVRGRSSPARFQVGPDKLRPRVEDGRRVYEFTDPDFGPTLLAPVGNALVVSAVRGRLDDALACAADPGPVRFRYPALATLLKQVDTKQALWVAASLEHFGAVGKMQSRVLELVVRPVFTHALSITGGLTAADDLRAELTFRARDDEGARRLEDVLKSVVFVAQGAGLLPGVDRDWLPFFQLLGTGETARDGAAVVLRCRLTAEQLSR